MTTLFKIEEINKAWEQAKMEIKEAGLVERGLEDHERKIIARALNTHLSTVFLERKDVVYDIYSRHLSEILVGAAIAKEQMDAEIGGMFPKSGAIGGPVPVRAVYLGVGKDWEDIGPITTGTAFNWIHSGTTLMGGTAGRPVRIGRNAVHVIFGIGDYHPSPKLENVKFEINGHEKPVVTLHGLKLSDIRLVEFEKSLILKRGTTILATLYASDIHGSTVNDVPYLFGVSFILEDKLRIQDPTAIPGTVHEVVVTT